MKKYLLTGIFAFLYVWLSGQVDQATAVDSLFAEWDRQDVPGCALGIVQDGKLVYARGYGSGDLEHDIAIGPSSVFYIGSVSKQFVTFCILLLEEQGKLDLDDKIQKFLPDFPEYGSPLTIRHFIHHTSGVRDYLTLMNLKGRNYLDHITDEEVYELIKRQEQLNFPPGQKYLYSNSCYFMLAMIIEKAAGMPIREFADINIFQPLGMVHTRFHDDNSELIKDRVFSYARRSDGEGFDNLIMRFDLVGSGGVYTNVEDLFLWDQNFYANKLGKGGQEIIGRMHEEGLLNNGESCGYAFALNNGEYRGLRTVSHGGSLAGYRAQLLRFPDQQFSVILLANRSDANPTGKAFQISDLFLADKFIVEDKVEEEKSGVAANNPEPAETDRSTEGMDLEEKAGSYYSRELDASYHFFVEDGILKVKIGPYQPLALTFFEKDKLSVGGNGPMITFNRKDEQIVGFQLDAGRVQGLVFIKM